MPLDVAEWHAYRTLDATEWHSRAVRTRYRDEGRHDETPRLAEGGIRAAADQVSPRRHTALAFGGDDLWCACEDVAAVGDMRVAGRARGVIRRLRYGRRRGPTRQREKASLACL